MQLLMHIPSYGMSVSLEVFGTGPGSELLLGLEGIPSILGKKGICCGLTGDKVTINGAELLRKGCVGRNWTEAEKRHGSGCFT